MNANLGHMLTNMLVFATTAHAGQYDKSGKPYILHPLKVMYYLKTEDEELQCIALGHDVIEDCKKTYRDLEGIGMSTRVIEGIKALTKVPGETLEDYKCKVKSNFDAVMVKLEDLRHNLDVRRLKGISEKDNLRTQEYHKFYTELIEHRREKLLSQLLNTDNI